MGEEEEGGEEGEEEVGVHFLCVCVWGVGLREAPFLGGGLGWWEWGCELVCFVCV